MSEETASGAVSDARSWRLANKINAMEVKKKNYVHGISDSLLTG